MRTTGIIGFGGHDLCASFTPKDDSILIGHGSEPQIAANMAGKGGVWRSDAVYTMSQTAPEGLNVIDNKLPVLACARTGIKMTRRAM
ncbi:MAG: hypothetical protein HKP40_09140 [Litoreibacter sp.]|nr:hypothetical protein [Litoreibacter sp.]